MTYVVTEACIRCKYMDCVEVCPVDCFYEGDNMLVIHPDECIDCGVCEPECPVDAILPDTETAAERWLELNREYSNAWPTSSRARRASTRSTSHPSRAGAEPPVRACDTATLAEPGAGPEPRQFVTLAFCHILC